MSKVRLHIYDVTNGSENRKRTIVRINDVLYGVGLGGIFHTAIQVYGDYEWSFGYCEGGGSGVFRCPAGKNTMYKYRKSLVLGETNLNFFQVVEILSELRRKWPGDSYDSLSRNCNHFSHQFCERLGVPQFPGWINRFANAGVGARERVENTALRFRKAKTNIVSASKTAYWFLFGVRSNVKTGLHSPTNSNSSSGRSSRFQAALLKNLSTKPSSCFTSIKRDEPQQQTPNRI